MKLRVIPDPAAPGGGFGYLLAEGSDISEGSVSVQVRDAYSGRWLGAPKEDGLVSVGDRAWLTEPHTFGPYPAQAQGAEIWVRIGPEIVNKIGEYTPLRITIEGNTADLVWPDDVLPQTAQALDGQIRSTAPPSTEFDRPRTVMAADIVEEIPPMEQPIEDLDEDEEPPRHGWLTWVLALSVLAAIAALLLWPSDATEQSTGIAYEPDTEQPASNPCSHTSIAENGGGYVAMEAAVRDCGARISANEAIRLLEMGVREGSPDALLLFGKIYDVRQKDDLIEETIGLTFEDDPVAAAEYYHRARAAGSPEAQNLLIVVCERLTKSTSTLARGAVDDYCAKP